MKQFFRSLEWRCSFGLVYDLLGSERRIEGDVLAWALGVVVWALDVVDDFRVGVERRVVLRFLGLKMVREKTALVATKWVGLAAAIWVQASAGNAYMFPFFSPALKSVLHYNQVQLNNLGVAKDFGENVGLIAGLLSNKLPPWILLCTGALFGCLGYGTLWLVVSEQIAPLPYWQVRATFCLPRFP